MNDSADQLNGPHRIYALAIRSIEMEYRRDVHSARVKRDAAVKEALEACETALRGLEASGADS